MARPNIESLLTPRRLGNDLHDVSLHIESEAQARRETGIRLSKLQALQRREIPCFIAPASLDKLIGNLEGSLKGRLVPSPACPIFMRERRVAILSEVARCVAQTGVSRCSTATVIPPGWVVAGGRLSDHCGSALVERFRVDLNRCGATQRTGWLFAALHGEFEPYSSVFKPHMHLVAAGEMVSVVDELRRMRKYAPSSKSQERAMRVARPIQIDRRGLFNMPLPVTYVLKPYWPGRYVGPVGDSGQIKRSGRQTRIPPPFEAEQLLWLDQYKLSDITLLMKLGVRNGRLSTH